MKRYSGRDFSAEELASIRALIADNPTCTRADLSRLACQALRWYKADGGLKEMSCRVAMLRMQDDGLIQLPVPTGQRPKSRIEFTPATAPQAVVEQPANGLTPLQFCPVVSRAHSRLWNEYIHRYHYLGYKTLPGAQLRYFVTSGEHVLALLGFGASAWEVGEKKRVFLSAKEAYGPILEENFREFPLEAIPEVARQTGRKVMAASPGGNEQMVDVVDIRGDKVVLDFNHPLAGIDLRFDVTVITKTRLSRHIS